MVEKEVEMQDESRTMLTAQVPTRMFDAITTIARDHDRSRSAEVRRALELHLRLAEAEKLRERKEAT
jgi:hypothetical protein